MHQVKNISIDATLSAMWFRDHAKHFGEEAEVQSGVFILGAAGQMFLVDFFPSVKV